MTDDAKPIHLPLDPVPPYIPVTIEDQHRLHPAWIDFVMGVGLLGQLVPIQWLRLAEHWKPGLVYLVFVVVTAVCLIRIIVKWALHWHPQPWAYLLVLTASLMNLSDHLVALPVTWALVKLSASPVMTMILSGATWHNLYEQTGHPWRQPVR